MNKPIRIFLLVANLGLLSACAGVAPQNDNFKLVASADAAYARGDLAAAERDYRALAAAVPQDAYAWFKLGNTLARQHRFDEAAAAYGQALVRDPGSAKVYNNLATLYLLKAEFALEASIEQMPANDPVAVQARRKLDELRKLTQIPLKEVRSPSPVSKTVRIYVEKEKPPRVTYPGEALQ